MGWRDALVALALALVVAPSVAGELAAAATLTVTAAPIQSVDVIVEPPQSDVLPPTASVPFARP